MNILIEDDGIGIEESKLDQLFESGIGVSNVNERLRVLFGPRYRMAIESRPGEGTQTTLEIPDREEMASIASGETFDQALRAASSPVNTPRI